jgi:hypothetical protein
MTLTIPLSCQLKITQIGWWISFPHDSKAGILLADPDEQADFLADRGVSIEEAIQVPLICSWEFYQQACSFLPPF